MKTRGRHRIKPRRRPGFTLIEVLIAMIVIVISVIALISLLSAGMRMDMTSNNNTAAVLVAKGYMEKMLDYSDFGGADTVFNDATTVRRQVVYNGDSTTYKYNWNVLTSPAPYSSYYKEYVVNVYWGTSGGKSTTSITLISSKWSN